jgi:hypothetical protein
MRNLFAAAQIHAHFLLYSSIQFILTAYITIKSKIYEQFSFPSSLHFFLIDGNAKQHYS